MSVEALFPEGRERFELASSSGWSQILGIDAVGGPPHCGEGDAITHGALTVCGRQRRVRLPAGGLQSAISSGCGRPCIWFWRRIGFEEISSCELRRLSGRIFPAAVEYFLGHDHIAANRHDVTSRETLSGRSDGRPLTGHTEVCGVATGTDYSSTPMAPLPSEPGEAVGPNPQR
jgi:hypothetical protein